MKRIVLLASLLGLLLAMISCAAPGESVSAPSLPTGSWTLTTIESEPLPDPLPPGLRPITLTIDDSGEVSGNAGINRYSGTVDTGAWENCEIVFGPLAVTRMAGPPAAMSTESAYLGLLNAVRTFEIAPDISADTLTLRGDAGDLLVYQRAE